MKRFFSHSLKLNNIKQPSPPPEAAAITWRRYEQDLIEFSRNLQRLVFPATGLSTDASCLIQSQVWSAATWLQLNKHWHRFSSEKTSLCCLNETQKARLQQEFTAVFFNSFKQKRVWLTFARPCPFIRRAYLQGMRHFFVCCCHSGRASKVGICHLKTGRGLRRRSPHGERESKHRRKKSES